MSGIGRSASVSRRITRLVCRPPLTACGSGTAFCRPVAGSRGCLSPPRGTRRSTEGVRSLGAGACGQHMREGAARDKIWRVRAWRIVPIALVLTGAVACTGGSGGDKTDPATPSPTSSAVSSPSSTPPSTSAQPTTTAPSVATTGPNVRPGEKPPTLPTALDTNRGALDYARYWFRALDWAYATTDSALARTVYVSSCTDCTHFLSKSIDEIAKANEHFKGGRISIQSTTLAPNDGRDGSSQAVDVRILQGAATIVDAHGRTTDRMPATGVVEFRSWLKWTGTRWVLVDWKTAVS
ncbi:DUF6318 family protein [uncultured Jatrophihabitans sp.]|uniref:DUF6318 family protein n=1 Tax=uncultured Jatrophihabitans sp. TaxID=1610747 RepID=UPI0035CC9AF9